MLCSVRYEERVDQYPRKLQLEMTGRGWEAGMLLSVYQTGALEVGSALKSGIAGSSVYIPSMALVCCEACVLLLSSASPSCVLVWPLGLSCALPHALCLHVPVAANQTIASVVSWGERLQSGFSQVLGWLVLLWASLQVWTVGKDIHAP